MDNRCFLLIFGAAFACGCSQDKPNAALPAPAPKPVAKLTITGPKGKLSLGDALDQAKKAFPAPAGAQVYDTSLAFAIAGNKGWAWQTANNSQAFEVMLRDDKVAAVAITYMGTPEAAIKSVESEWGAPTHRTVGKTTMAESWVSGDLARMAVMSNPPGLGKMGFTMLGLKSDLRLLSYDPDDPSAFVKQMDAVQATAKEMEPAFREAKQKAMAKASRRRQEQK
jgi:hypothetical protein